MNCPIGPEIAAPTSTSTIAQNPSQTRRTPPNNVVRQLEALLGEHEDDLARLDDSLRRRDVGEVLRLTEGGLQDPVAHVEVVLDRLDARDVAILDERPLGDGGPQPLARHHSGHERLARFTR
jgi:hypothetical protein